MLSMGVEIAELYASQFAYKVMINKIARAKRGIPSHGHNIPFGRLFDWKRLKANPSIDPLTLWSVDPIKKKLVENMARDYLKDGSGFKPLSKKYGKPAISIWHLFKRAGPEFRLQFDSQKFNIHEEVKIPVPALLDPRMLAKVQAKAEDRALWDHKAKRHDYLFKGLIFDAESANSLTGLTVDAKKYYRSLKPPYLVPGDSLESIIFEKLVDLVLHKESIRKAVFGDDGKGNQADELRANLADLDAQLKNIQRRKENFQNAIGDFDGTDIATFLADMKPRIKAALDQEKNLVAQKQILENELSFIPTLARVETMREQLLKRVKEQWQRQIEAYQELPFVKKRAFVLMLLEGKDEQGKRYGLYVQKKAKRTYTIRVHGRLEDLLTNITPDMLLKF